MTVQSRDTAGAVELTPEGRFEVSYDAFLTQIQSLQDLLEMENDLLRHNRRNGSSAYEERKEELSARLRDLMAVILETPQFLQGSQNQTCILLIERVKRIQRLLSENRTLLNAAKAATFRRIEAAVETHRRCIESGRRYGQDGEAEGLAMGPIPSAVVSRKI